MIPKKIHYLWFGGKEKPDRVLSQIDEWQSKLPDYEIIEWNETNYELPMDIQYVREAYEARQWAFVTDYVRLDILNEHGGIYLDTDVEIVGDFTPLLHNKSFMGMESYQVLCTAVIGTEANQPWLEALLSDYEGRQFVRSNGNYDMTPNSKYIWQFLSKFQGNKPLILTADVFSPLSYATRQMQITENTITIHHYAGEWKTSTSLMKDRVMVLANRLLGEKLVVTLKNKIKK